MSQLKVNSIIPVNGVAADSGSQLNGGGIIQVRSIVKLKKHDMIVSLQYFF